MRGLAVAMMTALAVAAPGHAVSRPGPARTAAANSLAAFAGQHPLTTRVSVALAPKDGGWSLSIGTGEAAEVERDGDSGWRVPSLGIHLSISADRTLWIARYGERVALAGPGAVRAARRSTEQMLADLTPRSMIAFNVPGVSIALVRNRKVAWLGQYGVPAAGQAGKVGTDTVFEAASMSKPVFAYVAMQLVQQHRLDLDAPLVATLGGPYIPNDPRHEMITARMVLSHTSGFPNWRRGGSTSAAPLTIGFEPGARYGYSGEGILFLQRAVEKLLGVSADRFMSERLLRPLGMTRSSYVWDERFAAHAAAGHDTAGRMREPRRLYRKANAAFTLYTTPRDYAQVLIEMMRTDRSAAHSLDAATLATMLAPAVDTTRTPIERGGRKPEQRQFALGWAADTLPDGRRYSHSGANATGFRSHAEFDPATGNGIVIMTNAASGTALWAELIRVVG